EAAAVASGAARVADEAVALDQDRPVRFGDLDRDVRDACARIGETVVPVGNGPTAPRPDDQFAVQERVAVLATREEGERRAYFARSGYARGDQLREGPVHH